MIIHKIAIKNFGPHKSSEVVFNEDITAIIGGNGVGKSFLIEAIPAVLFGEFPSRGGSIVDHVTQGFMGDALLSVEFSISDQVYIAERKIRKTAKGHTQDAFLYSVDEDGRAVTLAGPKILNFEEAIVELVGDSKIFFASCFSAQNNVGDIVECNATDRKRILAELLNLNSFQEQSEVYSAKARELEGSLLKYEAEKSTLESMKVETIPDIDAYLKQNAVWSEDIVILNTKIQQINERKATLEAEYKSIQKIQIRKDKLDTQIDEFEIAIVRNNREIVSLKELSGKVEELREHQANREKTIIDNQSIVAANGLAQRVIDFNSNIDNQVVTLKQRIREVDYDINLSKEKLTTQRNNLQKTASLLDSGNYTSSNCSTCDFLQASINARNELNALPESFNDAEFVLKKSELQAQIDSLLLSKQAIPLVSELLKIPIDRSAELNNALVADHQLLNLLSQNTTNSKLLVEMIADCKSILVPSADKLILAAAEIKLRLSVVNAEIVDMQGKKDSNAKIIAVAEEQIKRNAEISAKLGQLELTNHANKKNHAIYKYLADFFGRRGIQALLIDNAIPQLQTISDELLQIATDGRMSIEFSTTKENKDGSQRESLEILCTDEKGTRDVSHFSGGEQKILRSIIRLTLAIFQSQQSKKKLQTLVIDEAFDALDATNAGNLLNTLQKVS